MFSKVLVALTLVATAFAAPAGEGHAHGAAPKAIQIAEVPEAANITDIHLNDLQARQGQGSITYYNPGLGACGWNSVDSDYIVALSAGIFDSQHPCGRGINVYYNGRSVWAFVVDRCAGCAWNDIDLSPAAFQALTGDLGLGRVTGTWSYA